MRGVRGQRTRRREGGREGGRERDVPMDLCRMKPRMERPKTRKGRKRPTKALYLLCMWAGREGGRGGKVVGFLLLERQTGSKQEPNSATMLTYLSHG